MIDEKNTNDPDLTVPDFLDRASPEVKAIVEAGRALTLQERKTELAKATAPTTFVAPEPKTGSATAMAAKPATPAKVVIATKPKPFKVVAGKKSDAEMIALIQKHRAGTAGKTLKVLRDMGISCSQERFKKLYAKA